MKALPLLAGLALLAAPALAQEIVTRDGVLRDIATWRSVELAHTIPADPLTAEFEPRLDVIAEKVKGTIAGEDLAQPAKEFKTWQHDLLLKKFAAAKTRGLATGTLDDFSNAQRVMMKIFNAQSDHIVQLRLKQTAAGADGRGGLLFDGGGTTGDAVSTNGGPGHSLGTLTSVDGPRLDDKPVPAPSAKALSLASLRDYFDYSGISDAVVESVEKIKNEVAGVGHLLSGFAGSCYYGVKWMMIKTHMLPPEVQAPEQIGKIGIGSGNAYMMSAALKKDPKLQAKLRVRPLDLTTVKDEDAPLIPERTLFVFDRGCAGYSAESGHIEYSLARGKMDDLSASVFYRVNRRGRKYKPVLGSNEVLACSDGCMVHTMAYLRTYGKQGCLNAYVPVNETAAAPRSEMPATIGI